MLYYPTDELTSAEQYKLLSSSIVPRPIAWISTKSSETGVVNVAPFSFFTGASNAEPLLTVAILRENQQMKDTAVNLLAEKEGVIHLVDESLLPVMNETARRLESNQSELDFIDVTLISSETVKTPAIQEAKMRFETVLHQYIPIKSTDQKNIVTDLFILKVTAFHFSEEMFDNQSKRVKLEELKMVGRLSGPNYVTEMGPIIHLPRPK